MRRPTHFGAAPGFSRRQKGLDPGLQSGPVQLAGRLIRSLGEAPVCVEEVRLGEAGVTERICEAVSLIEHIGISDPEFLHEVPGRAGRVGDVHADEMDPVPVLLVGGLEYLRLPAARGAPRSPQVQNHRLPPEVGVGQRAFSSQELERHSRSNAGSPALFFCRAQQYDADRDGDYGPHDHPHQAPELRVLVKVVEFVTGDHAGKASPVPSFMLPPVMVASLEKE